MLEAGNSVLAITEQWERCCQFPGPALVRWWENVVYTVTAPMSICCSHHLDLTWMVLKPFVLVRSVIASQEGKLVCKITAPRNKRYVYSRHIKFQLFLQSFLLLNYLIFSISKAIFINLNVLWKLQCNKSLYIQKHKIHFYPKSYSWREGSWLLLPHHWSLTSCWGSLTTYITDLQPVALTCEELFNTLRWICSSAASLPVSGR